MLCSLANELLQGWTLARAFSGEPALVDQQGNIIEGPVDPAVVIAAIQDVLNAALSHLLESQLTSLVLGGAQSRACATLELELSAFPLSAGGFSGEIHSCSDLPICGNDYDLNCYTAPIPLTVYATVGQGNTLGGVLCGLVREGAFSTGSTLADILAAIQSRLHP